MHAVISLGFIALFVVLPARTADAQKDGSAMDQIVRKPAVAGQFYTDNPEALREEITGYLTAATPPAPGGDVIAIVSPHAGYMYSGQVAAYGYSLVKGKKYDAVVVISPSHTEYFPYAAVFPGAAYRTPLGDVPTDRELSTLIASKSDLVRSDMKGHEVRGFQRSEHSLEVQIPFLQVALGDFRLVAIVMGDQGSRTVEALGDALAGALKGKSVLIVASTDLSHFHNDTKARSLDAVFQERLREFDPSKLIRDLSTKDAEACGGGPVAAAMIAAKSLGATRCNVLQYANSGDVTGDDDSVVGYVSAAMVREKAATSASTGATGESAAKKKASSVRTQEGATDRSGQGADSNLTRENKIYLLRLARSVIESEVTGAKRSPPPSPSPVMRELRGAFVTLKKGGQLRGCIGYIEAIKPLATTIEEMAKAAAFDDWRFSPVRADEVPLLEIEISVLSPITEVSDPNDIVVGTHGLIMTRGSNRGLLLPQVPMEWEWDRETFLAQTCVKAGLPEDAWKQKGTKIESFTADVFSERELGLRK